VIHDKDTFLHIVGGMYHTTYRRQPFWRCLSWQFCKFLVIASDAEKMASVLNQIVENEGTHGSLQDPFLYMK
jgi:hypothetical protein